MENPQSPDAFGPKQYTYEQLAEATHKFSNKYLLGEGGFGQVYEGSLDGKTFAIKKLRYLPDQLEHEIRVVSGISHRNLVKLVGYCIEAQERNALLVLEYFPKKSLKVNLHNEAILDWPTRMKIAKGTAKGLQYLHEDCETKIIHQDIKPDNILLDNNFEPKIADFGLALVFPDHNTHISTSTVGTEVYRERSKKVSDKSDVYSFGVVLLELITGRKPIDEDIDIVAWAKALMNKGEDLVEDDYARLIDSTLKGHYNASEMGRMIHCAVISIYKPLESRPNMKQIVEVLEGRKSTKELWFVNSQQDSSPYNALAPKKDNPHGPKEFEYTVLADATGKFSYAHRLGGGGFGEVFSGTLSFKKNNRENLQSSDVAIKKLAYNKDKPGKEEFEKEIKAVGIVRHRCLVSLIGYCCDEYNRLLVLEFVPNKSLRFHLHGNQQPTLEWSKRMKIAISSAKGLEYLHKGCTPPIIHRDIKADNILIDNNFESKIADFGLAKFFPETGSVTHISTILKGTNIYADPEKYPSQKLSEKSDVYSFGVVLLELLTGKDPFAGDGIVKWAMPLMIEGNDLIKDNYADLIDSKLEGHYNPSQMTRMIYCAAASVYKPSISRPMMEEIVLVLQEKMPPENLWLAKGETSRQDNQSRKPYPNELEPPTLLRTFSFEELASVTSSFSGKHLLRDDYFFQVYKGVLPDNNNQNVAIKRIKHVSEQRKDEFEEEIEAINHVRHRNIITLIGYCSDKENNRLLVFEFISDNSLKFHLHGNGSSTDLDWSKRMKIAEGLAEGLKYMHEDCKPRILHLYVKSDNIFLNKKFEPKLAEFGSAKLFPDSVTHLSIDKIMKDSGYMAPEYDSTNKHLTDKFDVYSFGVILLELITGKEPVGDLDGHTTIVDWAKRHLSKGKDSFVDDKLLMKYDTEQMDRMIACALACVHGDPQNRPQMSEILEALKGRVSL
ncbi:uncharacterized protein LOC110650881 isoform X3 [Hevea brasiliensis]|uniref:uncharacterized protein LOC110650881 isoform X3 n=1 Tax=Hevea brasiliensis TaxID=3981 RepID=UPI0025EAD928|nr:uncharacterized protein LOC110650881 isoform X3 [Hevea brasiliensis]